ncbi:MAG TPA: lysophospholipid acyltransferase family protein [Longimicrobiales bacterium]|nr:lysophospholipid acyltransferase family protein [Longimicrobiales bacterium]
MSAKPLRHGLEYALFRSATGLLRVLPEGVALRAGALLGWVAAVLLRIRRSDVDRNLALAFPREGQAWRARVARASYSHLGREAVAMFRLADLDVEAVVARTRIEGLEALESALAEEKGVVMVTGHLGNWEVAGAALSARGFPLDVVAKGMANRRFGQDLEAARRRLGMRVVDMAVAPREVLRSLRAGRIVALVADQNARDQGIFVPFFGVPAATFRGPALFALRSGAPMFVGACLREPGWPQRYRIWTVRIDFAPSGDLEGDVARLTEAHTAVLERAVSEAPEQYFWQHKRWKTRRLPELPGAPPV